jgi:uncharacterized protein Yka (UPF0111/DUF47 family)
MRLISSNIDDPLVFDLLEEAGHNTVETARLLHEFLKGFPEQIGLAREIKRCEHEGDRLTHNIIHRLTRSLDDRRPFDPSVGHGLATALDDIVDYAEEVADTMVLYGVEAPMQQATALANVLLRATERVSHALLGLRVSSDMSINLVEIHRLENEGDRVCRDGVAALFAGGIDPMVVIRWKDIFETLECSVDACEKVAHVLEGIGLQRLHAPHR